MSEIRFSIEACFEADGRAYVIVRKISNSNFTLTESPTLGGVPIERWIDQPRSITADGAQDFAVFAFCLRRRDDSGKLEVGQIVALD